MKKQNTYELFRLFNFINIVHKLDLYDTKLQCQGFNIYTQLLQLHFQKTIHYLRSKGTIFSVKIIIVFIRNIHFSPYYRIG